MKINNFNCFESIDCSLREIKVAKLLAISRFVTVNFPMLYVTTSAYFNSLEICVHALKKDSELNYNNLLLGLKYLLDDQDELHYSVTNFGNRLLKIEF